MLAAQINECFPEEFRVLFYDAVELQPNAVSFGKAGTGAPGCVGFRTGTEERLADPDNMEKTIKGQYSLK